MELAANRTQADAFHASFQAFFEEVLVPDCLTGIALLNWITVMRHRSSCIGGALNQLLIMIKM